ncbi:hypothetical protein FS837_009967 [Tulasnella sp. UAMH 9824]|nr:hypothetical protein FS837_009967 [Tulasnella sp. UAMH 9824]
MTRLALPSIPIPADPDVHMAGELSWTANPGKRPKALPKPRRKKAKPRSSGQSLSLSDEPEMDLEIDMESEEEVDEGIEDEPRSPRILRNRPAPRITSAANKEGSDSGDEEDSGTSGSEFEPGEGQPQASGSASTSRPSARGSVQHGVTPSQPKAAHDPSLEADISAPEDSFSP